MPPGGGTARRRHPLPRGPQARAAPGRGQHATLRHRATAKPGGDADAGLDPVAARVRGPAPRNVSLRDRTLSEPSLVPREALTGHLGVFVPLPALHPDDLRLIQAKPPHTQHVTRFAERATHLTTEHA